MFDESRLEVEPESKKKEIKPITISSGQDIVCQITKEPIGEKGARITSYISLPGRYLVYFPSASRIGISRRIQERKVRNKLRDFAKRMKKPDVGLIIRTSAQTATEQEVRNEYQELQRRWDNIELKAKKDRAPVMLYDDTDILLKIVRDMFTHQVDSLVVDDEGKYKHILEYLRRIAPSLIQRVSLYKGDIPIFEHYKVEQELVKVLERKIWLKSGGFITIDQTEALVAIDVNSGKYSKEQDPETLIFQTNLQAAAEIAHQIRLRDLSGLIIMDFIDMEEQKKMDIVVRELKMCLENDRSKADYAKVSRFGILEMTRERTRPGLLHTLTEQCPICKGLGRVLSRVEIAMKIEHTLFIKSSHLKGRKVKIVVSPLIYDFLITDRQDNLAIFAKKFQMALDIKPDTQLQFNEFKVYKVV
ncbi:MAG: Rne/Rng family ribonuclease [Ignavibacteria bacterium]|nr:Rne/Rng family ribonuclease [Ignavibacteria bacterium]